MWHFHVLYNRDKSSYPPKIAYCSALCACAKSRRLWTCRALNLLPQSFSATSVSFYELQMSGNIPAFWTTYSYIFTARAQRRLLMSFRWKLRHAAFHSLIQISLLEINVSAIRRFLVVFFPWISWASAYWPRKCVISFDSNDDNFHQIWSWYDHPLPS